MLQQQFVFLADEQKYGNSQTGTSFKTKKPDSRLCTEFLTSQRLTDIGLFLHNTRRAKTNELGPLARAGLYKLSYSFLKNLNLTERCVESKLDFEVDDRIW